MRQDANLQYLHTGPKQSGKGRKKLYAGKVDVKKIDKRKWKLCYEDEDVRRYELKVHCMTLKQTAKVVYLEHKKGNSYTFLLCTDVSP